ncbi:hypothetical protein K523DRAFT_139594 [Schizophyllum commune Tattone D]|nr:hypothetical protein K523DRAFT_139594 [Schizophyllum commune Tattone D]
MRSMPTLARAACADAFSAAAIVAPLPWAEAGDPGGGPAEGDVSDVCQSDGGEEEEGKREG